MEKKIVDLWYKNQMFGPINIIKHGSLNIYDGPDIQNVEIEINHCRYFGSVEVETHLKDWYYHGHFRHPLYQYLLLHFVEKASEISYPHGFMPQFTYAISDQLFCKNQRSESFISRKFATIRFLASDYSVSDIFKILFVRSLGSFKMREEANYFAYCTLQNFPIESPTSYAKSIHPNNRWEKRIGLASKLLKKDSIFESLSEIIKNRYPLNKSLKEIQAYLNVMKLHLSKERSLIMAFNALYPLEYYLNLHHSYAYQAYLEAQMNEMKSLSPLAKFHANENLFNF